MDEVKLADVLQRYAADKIGSVHNPKRMLQRIERLNEFFGNKNMIGGATGEVCRSFVVGRGPVAARRELEILQAAINHWLKEAGQQKSNVSIWMPSNPRPREQWFTRKEAALMLLTIWRAKRRNPATKLDERMNEHLARFFLIALYTGTRSSAVFGLRWMPSTDNGWVDLENGLIYREGQRSKRSNKRQTPVKIPPRLLSHLKRWQQQDHSLAGYVVSFNGKPVKSVKTAWNTSKKAAGIPVSHTPHTLRHTRATWLMQRGTPIWEAASSLGMTVQQLERSYGHHHPNFQEAAANAF